MPIPSGRLRARVGCGRAPVVLYLGKLTPRKRVNLLVEAFSKARREDARLVVAGNDMGSLTTIQGAARQHQVQDRTYYTGLLTGRERLEALADADVVVYQSDHEVFGLVPLEAVLCGTPVIVADDSGCGDPRGSGRAGRVAPTSGRGVPARPRDLWLRLRDGWSRGAVSRGVSAVAGRGWCASRGVDAESSPS